MSAAPVLELDPIGAAASPEGSALQRVRKRPPPIQLREEEAQAIVERVKRFADNAESDREIDIRYREQRYAKLMQWAEVRNEPWEDATSVTLPDIITACLRIEDTLCNAAQQTRPMVNTKALDPMQRDKQRKADLLLDAQFFVEQPGEKLVQEIALDFVRDGTVTCYLRWVMERRETIELRDFEPIPLDETPEKHFRTILEQQFRTREIRKLDEQGWDWEVREPAGDLLEVRFYTDDREKVQMEVRADRKVFDGPAIMVVPYEDVLHPYWCSNLQAASPSNPKGSEWVILRDRPTLDEVGRLIDRGVYDRLKREDIEDRAAIRDVDDRDNRTLDEEKDSLRGFSRSAWQPSEEEQNHGRTLRYTCFDLWARDGRGKSIDVVWTVLPDFEKLACARPLSEAIPGTPPRRPFAEGTFIPVQNRRIGIGVPELVEGLHDFKTHTFNQMGDACDMEIMPFFTYRPSASINPEVYRLAPGVGLPQANPGDINFARIQPTATTIAINEIALADQMEEKLISQGDLQFGRVPAGKSAALRTSGGIQQLLAQGEARPEQLLRRFFGVICDVFSLMYQLDQAFLEPKKRFRVIGVPGANEDPFVEIDRRTDLSGPAMFDFEANVLNTSKAALQQSLSEALTLLLNPLSIQLGLSTPDTLYRLFVDYFRSLGQTDKYVNTPTPEAAQPKILAEEALAAILRGEFPVGIPQEPDPQAHLDALQQLLQMEQPGGMKLLDTLEPAHRALLTAYLQTVQQRIVMEQQKAQMMANAQALQQQRQAGAGSREGGPPKGGDAPGPLAPNDVMDESLPSSGTPQ